MSSSSNQQKNFEHTCDYLVIGAGAIGMAFVDTLVKGTVDGSNRTFQSEERMKIIVVDSQKRPGGHWDLSYDFVRLHQPSYVYGVESEPLEVPRYDPDHRASKQELLDYYDKVKQKLETDADVQKKCDVKFYSNSWYHFEGRHDAWPGKKSGEDWGGRSFFH